MTDETKIGPARFEALYRWVINDPRPLPADVAADVEALYRLAAHDMPDRPLTVHDGGLAALPPDLERELRNKL